jgi:polysaccharide pyruvyl transferase WcaK-like protein
VTRVAKLRQLLSVLRERGRAVGYLGWVGHGNLGDEVLLEAHRRLLHPVRVLPRPETRLMDFLERRMPRLAFRNVLLGGGTFILTSPRRLSLLERYAQEVETRLFCLGTGVGHPDFWSHVFHEQWDAFTRRWVSVLSRFRYIGVRGPHSKAVLEAAGLANVEVVGDTALALAPERELSPAEEGTIGVNLGTANCLMWGDETAFLQEMDRLLHLLAERFRRILLLPVWRKDLEVCRSFSGLRGRCQILLVPCHESLEDFLRAASACQLVVAEKLHAGVLACMARRPVVMLAYRPKCLDFLAFMGLERFAHRTDQFSVPAILDSVDAALRDAGSIRAGIEKALARAKEQLQKGSRKIRMLLSEPPA